MGVVGLTSFVIAGFSLGFLSSGFSNEPVVAHAASSPTMSQGSSVSRSTTRAAKTTLSTPVPSSSDWGGIEELSVPKTKSDKERLEDKEKEAQKKLDAAMKEEKANPSDDITSYYSSSEKNADLSKLTHDAIMAIHDARRPANFNRNHPTGDTGNAYSFSQCTWWAYKRRHDLGLSAGSHMGNGQDWVSTAKSLGYWVDSTPMPGDAFSLAGGVLGSSPVYGHVAIVEYVYPNGDILTSESGASLNGGYFSRRITKDTLKKYNIEFIHE